MTKEQINYLVDKFGIENLVGVEFNNEKRFQVYNNLKSKLSFDRKDPDYTLNYLELDNINSLAIVHEDIGPKKHVLAVPYDFVEGFLFNSDYNDGILGTNDDGSYKQIKVTN